MALTQEPVVEMRWLEPGEAPAVIELWRSAFGRWPPFGIGGSAAAYLDWFLEGFGDGGGRAAVGLIDGRLAAAGNFIVRPVRLLGQRETGYHGGQWVTVPEFQGQGLYRRLQQFAFEKTGAAYSIGYSQVAGIRTVTGRMGEDRVGDEMATYLRVVRPFAMAGNRLKALGYLLMMARGRARRRSVSAGAIQIEQGGVLDERFDDFEERALGGFDLTFVRSAAFMNWRYGDARAGAFLVRLAWEGAQVVGCCVSKLEGRRGHIVDVFALPGRDDAVELLLEDAVGALAAQGATAVECWMMRRHPVARSLRRQGFVALGKRSAAVARMLNTMPVGEWVGRTAALAEPDARLHIVEGDSDLL